MLIIIDRELSEQEEEYINELLIRGVKYIFLQTNSYINNVDKLDIPNNFYVEKTDEFLNKIIEFPHKIFNSSAFNNIYKYNKIKLFYYHKFRVFHSLKENFVLSEFIKANYNSKEILLYSNKNNIKDFFKSDYIVKLISKKKKQNKREKYLTIIKYSIFVFIRYFISLFRNYNLKNIKHLVIENTKPIKLIDKNLNIKYDNVIFSYLYDKLNSDALVFNVIDIPKSHKDFKFLKYYFINTRKNVKTFYYENAFINNFSFKAYKRIKNQLKKVNVTLNEIIINAEVVDAAIIKELLALNKTTVFYLVRYESLFKFFNKHNFKTFVATDENGSLTKGIVDAAKSANIKTYGTQHGGMGKLTLSYILSKKDNLQDVIPSKTFVWGEYWKDFLIKSGNYPAESVEIVGQLRTDIIPKIKSKIEEKPNTIIFASQPMPNLEYKKRAAIDVLNLAKQNPSINLIIKLHPFEYDGIDYYNKIANELDVHNYIISKDDLYLLIGESKMVITCFSTVGAEAIYFKKPLVIIDYKNEDLLKYIKSKIAFGVYNFNDLNKISNQIINQGVKLNKIDIDNYINNYAYKIDGKVSERIIQTVYYEK